MKDAADTIRDKGWDRAQRDWFEEIKSGKVSKENTAMGWTLYNHAAHSGNTELAMDVLVNMVEHQRSAAQAVQASRILKKMSPEGQLYGVERSVNNLTRELRSKYGNKYREIKIDPELAGKFPESGDGGSPGNDSAEGNLPQHRGTGAVHLPGQMERLAVYVHADKPEDPHPERGGQRRVRSRSRVVKNEIAAGIETALSLAGVKIERTKSFVSSPAMYRAAWNDFNNMAAVLSGSQLQNDDSMIEQYRRIFSSKVLESLRRFNAGALDAEDMIFKRITYADSLAGYLQANGVKAQQLESGKVDPALLQKARDYAALEALKATYQDRNAFSDRINRIAKAMGPAGDAILPFRRTPANILMRGLEYSPFGLAKSILDSATKLRSGKMTAAQVIDEAAAGLTGTALFALGAYLLASGIVTGSDDDEWDDLTGHQQYALEIGGKSFTIDWLAPQSIPFFMGVELASSMGESGMPAEAFLNAMQAVSNPLLELSMLQSLNDIIEAAAFSPGCAAPGDHPGGDHLVSYTGASDHPRAGGAHRTGCPDDHLHGQEQPDSNGYPVRAWLCQCPDPRLGLSTDPVHRRMGPDGSDRECGGTRL